MNIRLVRNMTSAEQNTIHRLWNQEYPKQLQHQDLAEFQNYLNGLSDLQHFLLYNESKEVVGWALQFTRTEEVWFAVILNSTVHGKGYGTRLLNELKKTAQVLNGWVIDHNKDLREDGKSYNSPLDFYLKNDFKVLADTRLESEKISVVKIQWKAVIASN